MRVEWNEAEPYTPEEEELILRLRRALSQVGVRCVGRTSKNMPFHYDITAMVMPKTRTTPITVNFKATNRRVMGQAMIGPEKELNVDLFDGGEITKPFHAEIITAVNEFIEAISTM